MSHPFVETKEMTVGYRGVPLIRDIALSVHRGEILTLIGPNGSGKSTILKSLIRQLALIGGTVYLDGKSLQTLPERDLARTMSVLLTEHVRPELMTCWDVAAAGRYPYTGRLGMLTREDEEKVEKAMRAVHAEELGGRDFNAISDGQRQRVLLARAICQVAGGHHPRRANFFPRYPPQAGTARDSAPHGKGEGHHRHHVAA